MREEGRIKEIIKETILALLNNGVEFTSELQVDGLLGVTVDSKDVFLVKISEVVPSLKRQLAGHVPQQHGGDSSDEESMVLKAPASSMSPSKRRKRRSPSPKQTAYKIEKRQRMASPTQSIPSSTSTRDIKNEEALPLGQVDIDLTSVKTEPVDTTVADSNQSADMSESFEYNQPGQQAPIITSIQSVTQQAAADSDQACSSWQASQQDLWEGDFSDEEEDYDEEDDEEWDEAMMIQHQQQMLLHQQRLMPPPQRPPMQQQQQHQQYRQNKQQRMKSRVEPEEDEFSLDDDSSEEEASTFDYYKSNPKHPDITKAIMEGSKAVLEKIIGMQAIKEKAKREKQKRKEAAKKKKQQKKSGNLAAGFPHPVPFIKDAIDAQVIVKQEPLDAGDAELVVRPIPAVNSSSAVSSSTSLQYGNNSPQRAPMGPPPPPPPKETGEFLNYPIGPPLNTQYSPAAQAMVAAARKGSDGPYKCDICPYSCQRQTALQRHRLKEHGEGDMDFTCNDCPGLMFATHKELQNHIKNTHKQQQSFTCDCHGKVFRSPDSLADHLKKVARDECLTCQTCGKLFVRKDALLNHIQSKHGGSGGSGGSGSPQHSMSSTESTTTTTTTSSASSSGNSAAQQRSIPCTMCMQSFPTDEEMVAHLDKCSRSKLEKTESYFCDDCQLEFPTEVDLKDHMKTQHKQSWSCEICSKIYTKEKSLQAHMKKFHPEEMD